MSRAVMRPLLPAPPSWYPGHMSRFAKMLPALLKHTDVVLELRDARLPLTSINRTLEGALQRWRLERGHLGTLSDVSTATVSDAPPKTAKGDGSKTKKPTTRSKSKFPGPAITGGTGNVCEHIVVLNKRDLVAQWGMEPFRGAMKAKFPHQTVMFASWQRHNDVRTLSEMLVNIAKTNPDAQELNILVIGMPNVGKSTLLNALRHIGIAGPTAKALRTSALPGMTRTLSTRLKLSEAPPIYAYDSPGVMLPFLGRGEKGAERGVKLALIAGIKEGLYDVESLAAYLLYRLNLLDPIAPAYLSILPPNTPPTNDLELFVDLLAKRLGMLKRGGERDVQRAASWFVRWWREEGGLLAALAPPQGPSFPLTGVPPPLTEPMNFGWGFDIEWSQDDPVPDSVAGVPGKETQWRMERCIDDFLISGAEEEDEGGGMSSTQEKKMAKEALTEKRFLKSKAKLAAKSIKASRGWR